MATKNLTALVDDSCSDADLTPGYKAKKGTRTQKAFV